MPKKIRLLSTYQGNPPGTILTLPDVVADQLLQGNASLVLTGGKYPTAPAPVHKFYDPIASHVRKPKRDGGVKKFDGAMRLSGRNKSLAPFPFAAVFCDNGNFYTADDINANYPDGIPGVLEWVNDAGYIRGGSASSVPDDELGSWAVRCQPTHRVAGGRPRAQIVGHPLEFYKKHRAFIKTRPWHQADAVGAWNNSAAMPHSGLFVISQLSQSPPFTFDAGQLTAGASPLYIKQQGACVFAEIHTIANGMGVFPGDPGVGLTAQYPTWNVGDTETVLKTSSIKVLRGRRYHQITIDFVLDERREEDGGEGYIVGYFNGEFWFRHDGPTSLPRNAAGHLVPMSPRYGYYEVTSGAQAAGTLNSAVDAPNGATSVERTTLLNEYFVLPEGE